MDEFEKSFLRKVRIRKFAIENMGKEKATEADTTEEMDDQTKKLFSQLFSNLQEADESRFQDGYFPIVSHRKRIGKFIVLIKMGMRKLKKIFWGWYWFPIFSRQSFFNGKAVNALSITKDILLLHEQKENSFAMIQSEKEMEQQEEKILALERGLAKQQEKCGELEQKVNYLMNRLNVTCSLNLLKPKDIDYFDFENHFRGPRDKVKENQRNYVDYFRINGGGEILDIGCGRGEFLELMYDYGIAARGIDAYQPFVEYCQGRGFKVEQSDALTYLDKLEDNSLGGIFMSQVVEHLSNDYILSLIQTAYRKLKTGCCFILETPNPDCLAAISEFNIDISHIKPIHYKSLEYFFKSAHFESVTKYHTPQCKYPVEAVHLQGKEIENLEKFNQGIDHINNLVFGYRDYTLIARK